MTPHWKTLCIGLWGGLWLSSSELVAQRLEPGFASAPIAFVASDASARYPVPAERERCGRSSNPFVRGVVGAAAGAAAGYVLFLLNEKVLSWGGESTGQELRRERTRFIVGVAVFGAAFEVVVGPHICKLGRAGR
ncbi:MAG TPA: hypothetical protein VFM23_10270 [Gemmatimonadales bacterium]|nr:hypothetical protein [Gemmatimonadales bacterium]